MRRMLDPTKVGGIPSTIEFDKDGNREAKKNVKVDGKLTLNSLISSTNPDGDITKELGGSSRHGYRIIINDKLHYEVYTTKDYNWTIGEKVDISSKLWTDDNYKELRSPGIYPASGCYKLPAPSSDSAIVSTIEITDYGIRGNYRYDIKNNQYFSGSISRESASVVKLF